MTTSKFLRQNKTLCAFPLKKGSAEPLYLTEPSRTERFGSSFDRTFRPNIRFGRPLFKINGFRFAHLDDKLKYTLKVVNIEIAHCAVCEPGSYRAKGFTTLL